MSQYTITTADLDHMLREVLAQADYDLYKAYLHDEETGADTFHELVKIAEKSLAELREGK